MTGRLLFCCIILAVCSMVLSDNPAGVVFFGLAVTFAVAAVITFVRA